MIPLLAALVTTILACVDGEWREAFKLGALLILLIALLIGIDLTMTHYFHSEWTRK